ncbi:MAG: TetR family transcriptional regulator [Myxococcaceae bacterium]|nr:TetR family transcriptional regulator [Myxococcaceae bacterium]
MKFLALTLSCLLALPALAASQLEAARSSAKAAREQTVGLRAEQQVKRTQLSQLSASIETLKAQSKGKLLPGGELDSALKQSQALSDALTQMARTLSTREGELEAANLALVEALTQELSSLRADFDRQTEREARLRIVQQMKALRAEREQVRAALPAASLPSLPSLSDSEDPADLLAQLDLVKDQDDKVQRELKALDKRIADLKRERELDRRSRDFQFEESALDDADRRLNVRRDTLGAGAASAVGRGGNSEQTRVGSPPPTAPGAFGAEAAKGDTTASNQSPSDSLGGTQGTGSSTDIRPPTGGGARSVSASDARPVVGTGRAIAGGDDDDLSDLEVQRKKLQGLAKELKARAAALQAKASELK